MGRNPVNIYQLDAYLNRQHLEDKGDEPGDGQLGGARAFHSYFRWGQNLNTGNVRSVPFRTFPETGPKSIGIFNEK